MNRVAQELVDELFDTAGELATDGDGWWITGDQQVIVGELEDGDFTLYVSRDHEDDDAPVRRFRVRVEEVPDGTG